LINKIEVKKYITEKIGLPTLNDILAELVKPGRDPREELEPFSFAEGIHKLEDLEPGMKLPGIITNITAFGAFVDIGVHQDGLVHISQLADRYIKNPTDVVKVQQKVTVRVLEVDLPRQRISLSMRDNPTVPKKDKKKTGHEPGERPKNGNRKPIRDRVGRAFNKPFAEVFGRKK
jgi:uncharacterized protein